MLITDQINCYIFVDSQKQGHLPWGSPYYALGKVQQLAYEAMIRGKKRNIKIVTVDGKVLMEMKINEQL